MASQFELDPQVMKSSVVSGCKNKVFWGTKSNTFELIIVQLHRGECCIHLIWPDMNYVQ